MEVILIAFIIVEFFMTFAMMQISFLTLWNLLDFFLILALIGLYIADVIVHDFYASAVFKIRALFRMPKITLLLFYIISPPFAFKGKNKVVVSKIKSKGDEVTEILEGMKR